ncbi:hypothetical protein [Horticoccus sp. 23ND18S-11]|uniref:hypothetical protein n=1 Tax=Horticoccus sp. 23ND18S-11 TaxID=3391832 RepID=UPI0039C99824
MRRLLTACCVALACLFSVHAADNGDRFSFVAFGCMPYGRENFAAYERLLMEISRQHPAFTVHCGDTKTGSEPPTEAFLVQVKTWFNTIEGAVMYTPGDNEWTDVHRTNNGHEDPLVWLGKLRATYFSEERSLGRAPIPLVTQRRDPAFAKFVENARWTRGGVVFATVHVVGSNNNHQPDVPGAVAEFRERDAANAAWVRAAFAEARATNAPGVALFFQAQPFSSAAAANKGGRESGFTRFLATVEEEARAFAKPVLLVHADEHRYRLEPRITFPGSAAPLDNVTRLETFGANDIHAVLVTVDPAAPQVFLAGPLIVPSNALPMLPKPKKAAAPAKK